jgi:hypothetical protein
MQELPSDLGYNLFIAPVGMLLPAEDLLQLPRGCA